MEVQFKISGTYNDCYELLRAFHQGFRIEGILEEDDEPVVYKKQEPEPSCCRHKEYGIPDYEFTPPPPPAPDLFSFPDPEQVEQDAKKFAPDAKKFAPDANKIAKDAKNIAKDAKKIAKTKPAKRQLAPEDLQIHCHTCATLFHPKYTDMQHCSKRCYMIEWRETHKQPVVEKPVKCVVSPLAVLAPEERAKKLEALSKKLKEIKENCPAPTPRPDITKDLS
jgi:hypothetical protein